MPFAQMLGAMLPKKLPSALTCFSASAFFGQVGAFSFKARTSKIAPT